MTVEGSCGNPKDEMPSRESDCKRSLIRANRTTKTVQLFVHCHSPPKSKYRPAELLPEPGREIRPSISTKRSSTGETSPTSRRSKVYADILSIQQTTFELCRLSVDSFFRAGLHRLAQSEFFSDDNPTTRPKHMISAAWKHDFYKVVAASRRIRYFRRKMIYFESNMALNPERLGTSLDCEHQLDNLPRAIFDAQKNSKVLAWHLCDRSTTEPTICPQWQTTSRR